MPAAAANRDSVTNLDNEAPPASSMTSAMENAPVRPVPPPASARGPAAAPAPAAAPPPAAPPPSDPPPAAEANEWSGDDSSQDDGPTMAGIALVPDDLPLRDDVVNPRPHSPLASTGYRPGATVDKDAETVALAGDHPSLPRIGDLSESEPEETTRAVSREELMGHQDAQLVVGEDAYGDEATLAVAPGDLGADAGFAKALAERPPRQPPSQPELPSAPAFPAPPFAAAQGPTGAQPQSQPHQQVPSWQGEGAPSHHNPPQQPMGMQGMQGYDPMLPQQGHQSSPGMQSAPHGYPMQGGPPPSGYGPSANAPTAPGPQGMQGQPWLQGPPHGAGASFASKLTPQVIMLVVVGTVCLSIFVIGIVLFLTTNFQRP